MRRTTTVLLACTVLAACGGDNNNVVGPDDPACVKGQIAAGGTVAGQLNGVSCSFVDEDYSDNSTFFDSYTFQARAGKAYQITARADDDGFDYVLELFGSTSDGTGERVLSVADDEGGGMSGLDPQMLFIAPTSGAYSLRVMGYEAEDTSTYTLTARECPVHAVITTSFSNANQSLQTSDCVWNDTYFGAGSSRVALYAVHMDANTARTITVVSSDFEPGFHAGGPGFDGYCYLDRCEYTIAAAHANVDSVSSELVADSAGTYMLAVGSRVYRNTGTFKLVVDAAHPVAPPRVVSAERVRGSVAGIRKAKKQ